MASIPEIKQASQEGIDFLMNEEGCVLHPYKDQVGISTIGIGNTYYEDGTRVKMTDAPITKDRAIYLFRNVLQYYENTVWSITRDDITQNMFNALLSLCYNIGPAAFKASTVVKLVNKNPIDQAISNAFYMWRFTTVDGIKKPILAGRRKRESKLYFS